MANGWTLERRLKQAKSIHDWRPWDKATGPKTPEGKAKAAMRGYKGKKRQTLRNLMKALKDTPTYC